MEHQRRRQARELLESLMGTRLLISGLPEMAKPGSPHMSSSTALGHRLGHGKQQAMKLSLKRVRPFYLG